MTTESTYDAPPVAAEPTIRLRVAITGGTDPGFEFETPHSSLVFGTDPERCDLLIPAAPGAGRRPSRSGLIWREDDRLWLRNLSMANELHLVTAPSGRPQVVPRGVARLLPEPFCRILGPAGLDLTATSRLVPN